MRKPLTEEQKIKFKGYRKEYLIKNKDIINEKKREYRLANNEKMREKDKQYYAKNRLLILNKIKNKAIKRKPLTTKQNIKKRKNRIDFYKRHKENTLFRLKTSIGNLIRYGFNRNGLTKPISSEQILGCSFKEFKQHLEAKFEPWMNWENRGLYNGEFNYGWDIDHIIPIHYAKTIDEVVKLNHYTNLRPLCSKVNRNIKKGLLTLLIII